MVGLGLGMTVEDSVGGLSGIEGDSSFESDACFAMISVSKTGHHPPWRCNSGRTANIATRICRRIPRKRASALTNAPSVRTASRPGYTTYARTAAAALSRGRSGRQGNGGPAYRSKSTRLRPSGCTSPIVSTISLRIRRGFGKFRRGIADVTTPSFRGDAKHRTRNLGIPGLVLAHHPGMTNLTANAPVAMTDLATALFIPQA